MQNNLQKFLSEALNSELTPEQQSKVFAVDSMKTAGTSVNSSSCVNSSNCTGSKNGNYCVNSKVCDLSTNNFYCKQTPPVDDGSLCGSTITP